MTAVHSLEAISCVGDGCCQDSKTIMLGTISGAIAGLVQVDIWGVHHVNVKRDYLASVMNFG
jgi:hypothetical protein